METGWERLKFRPRSFRHITSPCNVRQLLQQTRQPPVLGGCLHTSVCQKPWMPWGCLTPRATSGCCVFQTVTVLTSNRAP